MDKIKDVDQLIEEAKELNLKVSKYNNESIVLNTKLDDIKEKIKKLETELKASGINPDDLENEVEKIELELKNNMTKTQELYDEYTSKSKEIEVMLDAYKQNS